MKIVSKKQIQNIFISIIVGIWLWVSVFCNIYSTINAYDSNNPRESQTSLDTSVSVRIVSNFEGYIKWWRSLGNQFFTGNIRWTNNPNIYVKVWASQTSSYQLTWWITWLWTGNGISAYGNNQFTTINWNDGIKYIYSDYTHIWGIYHTWVVPVWLDRTGPSKAKISFTSWAIMQLPFTISWTDANIDTWVWRSKYILHISMDPNFVSEIKKDLYTESYYIDTSKFPIGTIWWYIESVDHLGNNTPSDIQYFHNTLPSIPNHLSPDIPDDLKDYYRQIDSDRPIQDISTWDIKNIFDIIISMWTWKVIYNESDIKSALIYNYLIHGVADTRVIPTWVPKTWVDGIMKYLDNMVVEINEEILNPKTPINRSYMIVWFILLILGFIMILRSRSWHVDRLCHDDY